MIVAGGVDAVADAANRMAHLEPQVPAPEYGEGVLVGDVVARVEHGEDGDAPNLSIVPSSEPPPYTDSMIP